MALARALAARADVLLLDEPFSALDPAVRTEMHALVNELRAAVEPTILLVTHDQHEAAVLADTVGILLDGQIAQHGSVAELYARPHTLPVHTFLGGRNAITGHILGGTHYSTLGPLALPPSDNHADGAGTLVIRPEVATLTVPGGPDADVTGAVSAVVPEGARVQVDLKIAGFTLTASASAWDAPRVGTQIGLRLPMEHRHVIRESALTAGHEPCPSCDQGAGSSTARRTSPVTK